MANLSNVFYNYIISSRSSKSLETLETLSLAKSFLLYHGEKTFSTRLNLLLNIKNLINSHKYC